jgi:hypothetical protein
MSDSEVYYEDLSPFALDAADSHALLDAQAECTFCWGTKDGSPMGVIMAHVWHEGRVWLTATSQRKRIAAIRRNPTCAVVVTSVGSSEPPGRTVTVKGPCIIHEDDETKAWFYPALAAKVVGAPGPAQDAFRTHLDSPLRVVLELVPEKWITCDAAKMMGQSFAELGVG